MNKRILIIIGVLLFFGGITQSIFVYSISYRAYLIWEIDRSSLSGNATVTLTLTPDNKTPDNYRLVMEDYHQFTYQYFSGVNVNLTSLHFPELHYEYSLGASSSYKYQMAVEDSVIVNTPPGDYIISWQIYSAYDAFSLSLYGEYVIEYSLGGTVIDSYNLNIFGVLLCAISVMLIIVLTKRKRLRFLRR